MANPFFRHYPAAFRQLGRRLTTCYRCRHHVLDDGLHRVKMPGDHPIEHVPFSEDTDDLFTATHDQRANSLIAHDLRGLHDRRVFADDDHVPAPFGDYV